MLVIKEFQFNPFSENTYVISDSETGECAIIDAGCYYADEQDILSGYIIDNNLKVKYLLATHLHLDHNFGDRHVYNTFNVGLTAHPDDAFLLDNMKEQASILRIVLKVLYIIPFPLIIMSMKTIFSKSGNILYELYTYRDILPEVSYIIAKKKK